MRFGAEALEVTGHVGQIRMKMAMADLLGTQPTIPAPGPLLVFDHCGYGVAVELLAKSHFIAKPINNSRK